MYLNEELYPLNSRRLSWFLQYIFCFLSKNNNYGNHFHLFFRSIGVCSMQSKEIINIYCVNVFPCKTPIIMSKKSALQWSKRPIAIVFLKSIIIAITASLERPYTSCFALSFFCIWTQIPWRSQWTVALPKYFLLVLLRWFDRSSEFSKLWVDFYRSCSNFSKEFSPF